MRPLTRAGSQAILVLLLIVMPGIAQQADDPIFRIRDAEHVVVATVAQVVPMAVRNEYGDDLIISRVTLAVEEVLQGQSTQTLTVDIEGGTLGGLTLEVSDMPSVKQGDRGIFFVQRSTGTAHVLHRRGNGMLRLRQDQVIDRPGLTLDTIRRQLRMSPGLAPQ